MVPNTSGSWFEVNEGMMESYATRNWKDLETDFNERMPYAPGAGATVFGIPLDRPASDSETFHKRSNI